MNQSNSFELDKKDIMKILKGLGIAVAGAALTYATDIIPMIEWGEYKPMVVAISAVLVNFCWKLLKGR